MTFRQSRIQVLRTVGCFVYCASENVLIVTTGENLVFHFPSSNFHASVGINSQRGIEPQSLEVNIGLESINLTVDLVQELVSRLKPREPTKSPLPPSPQPSQCVSATPSLFAPMSPSLQFMVGDRILTNPFHSHAPPVVASRDCCKEETQENPLRCNPAFLPSYITSRFDDLVRPYYPQ